MELKDKIRALRMKRGFTQAQLAEALYVSRSTVAKWENGLGLPNRESMAELEKLFQVTKDEVATTEPETVIVEKNQKLHKVTTALWAITLLLVSMISLALPYAIIKQDYGFSPEMAAGVYSDNPYIDTGDYRIYYTSYEGSWDDGREWASLSDIRPVKKHFWGYTVEKDNLESRIILDGLQMVGRLYSIKGKYGYYNLIKNVIANNVPDYIVTVKSVTINGAEYDVHNGFFFVTQAPVEYFKIDDTFLTVE